MAQPDHDLLYETAVRLLHRWKTWPPIIPVEAVQTLHTFGRILRLDETEMAATRALFLVLAALNPNQWPPWTPEEFSQQKFERPDAERMFRGALDGIHTYDQENMN